MQPELSGEFEDWSFHHGKIQSRYHRRYGYGRPAVRPADGESPVVHARSFWQPAHTAQARPTREAIGEKWHMADPIPESVRSMVVMDAEADAEEIAKQVDFVFCAVNMKKDEIKALEERYAKLECPVVSNNSAHRHTPGRPDGRAGDQCGPHPHHRRPAQAPRHQARLHRRQVQLLACRATCPRCTR